MFPGKLRDQSAAKCQNLLRERRIFVAINHVDARAKHRDRLAFGGDGATMARRVDTSGQPTHH
jgi:hypothetical protein